MPCLVEVEEDGLTLICGGVVNGHCSSNNHSDPHAFCLCAQYFLADSNCTKSEFSIWGNSSLYGSIVLLVMYLALLFVFIAEVIPDFYNRYGLRAFRKPFPQAKIFASLFVFCWSLELVFYILNSNPSDPSSLKVMILSLISHAFAFAFFGLVLNLIILSWIYTIERTRTLERVRWVRPFKIAAIFMVVTIVLLHAATLPFVLLPSLNEIYEALKNLKLAISAIFLLMMLAVSFTVLFRGRYLWGPESIFQVVRFKSRVFMASLTVLVLYFILVISSFAISDGTVKTLGLFLVFSIASWMYLVIVVVFLQANLYKKGLVLYGWKTKHRARGTTKKTSEPATVHRPDMHDESQLKSMSTVSTMSLGSTASTVATNESCQESTALQ